MKMNSLSNETTLSFSTNEQLQIYIHVTEKDRKGAMFLLVVGQRCLHC